MNHQKVFFASNLKFLRERKKMSQETLAEHLNMKRSKLAAIEIEQTRSPQPEDYINCSNFFKVSIDSLLKVDLSRLSELKLRELEAGNDVYMMGSKIRVLAITVDEANKENVEYVPIKAKAGYMAGYNDPQFIAKLPRYTIPNLPKNGTYRIFPTGGDSMEPIPENSEILTQYVTDWKGIKSGTPCVVILKAQQDFVFKEVTVDKDGKFLLASMNPIYQPYYVQAEDILEIWSFYSFSSKTIPHPASNVDELKEMLVKIQKDLNKINKS